MASVEGGLPTGTVTFLFTDLEGSTRLWEEHPEAMHAALARHDDIVREAIRAHDGTVVKMTGDGAHAAFWTAHAAVAAAVDAQLALGAERWGETGPLRVRMGVHTGPAEQRAGDYFGPAINRAARVAAVAHGGQIVVSHATQELARDTLGETVVLRDLGEHELRDLGHPERLFQVLHPGLGSEFPPLRSVDVLPGNLPVQVASFVGRAHDMDRVAVALGHGRVVTLTGVGGVGKTRLALQTAAELLPGFGDGAWLCELAGVRDPEAVPEAVAAIFALQPPTGLTMAETLLEFLSRKELLLVLDNCEHLLSAVADLVSEVVRTCPGVRVLATSREGLNTAGEQILAVSSLEVPKVGADLDAIGQCEAVRLFVERAQAVKSHFALDAANASAVIQLCRRLDGVALAIELAAARIGMLTPTELANRLDQRFRLLTGGGRGTVERHQTLQAALDWSYQLLDEAEQRLLARLSVFAGGFSLEAAEAVTVGENVKAEQVFELLAALVAQSLVEAVSEVAETRYRLLETIRQYAQERLDEHGQTESLRAAHASYYARLAEEAVPKLRAPDGIEWERRLTRELDNLRTALAWAIDTEDVDTALCLLDMYDVGPTEVGAAFATEAEAALTIGGASEHPRFPGLLMGAAVAAHQRGDQGLAEQYCAEALSAEQRLGTQPRASIWSVRAQVAMSQGRAQQTVEYASHAVALCRARGDMTRLAWSLSQSATGRVLIGDLEGAIPETEEAIALTRRYVANPFSRASYLGLAAFVLADTQPDRALALMREAIELSAPLGTRSQVWAMAGDLATRLGNHHDALEYFANAIDQLHHYHARTILGSVLGRVADLLADEDPEAAAILLGANDAFAPDFANARHVIEARERTSSMLEASLGQIALDEFHARGLAMNEDETVTYAHAAINRLLARSTQA